MFKRAGMFLFLCFVVFAAGSVLAADYNMITREEVAKADRISVEELKEVMGSGKNVVVLDFRSPGSYKASGLKIKGDVRMQPEDLKADNAKLPKNKDLLIVTYCT